MHGSHPRKERQMVSYGKRKIKRGEWGLYISIYIYILMVGFCP
jgi:hypothetical protein